MTACPWTPTERLRQNYETTEAFEELRKAGRRHRAGNQRLLKALYDQGVEFIIIDSAAAVLHGSAYGNAGKNDLNIVREVLKSQGSAPSSAPSDCSFAPCKTESKICKTRKPDSEG
jgi:hypothetical protein